MCDFVYLHSECVCSSGKLSVDLIEVFRAFVDEQEGVV